MGRPARRASRFDLSISANQAKLDLVDQLEEVADHAGVSLTHLALAFTISHRGVTSAIIGPRTIDQLEDLLKGADVETQRRDARSDRCDRRAGAGY